MVVCCLLVLVNPAGADYDTLVDRIFSRFYTRDPILLLEVGADQLFFSSIDDRIRNNKDRRMTTENDIVLIYFEDQPLGFARIEQILPDHKPDWYHVKLLMLQTPLQVVSWILRDRYISGDEFTMNGKRMRLERVVSPDPPEAGAATDDDGRRGRPNAAPDGKATVISLADKWKR